MKIKDLLKGKGPQVFTIGEELKVSEAIKLLVKNNIGSLVVLDEHGKIAGILTERDILKLNYSKPAECYDVQIKEAMSTDVIIAEPEDEIEYAETMMTENRIRHLPVVEGKTLVGMISIGDVVKAIKESVKYNNKYLMDYISGNIS